ncbi:MAG: aminopeptidase YwaD [bacterium]
MSKILVAILLITFEFGAVAQVYNPNINKSLSELNRNVNLIKAFETFGIKSPGSQSKTNTYHWLTKSYSDFGYDSIRTDSFLIDGTIARNLVVTKPGLSDSYIVVCGHYDTRGGPGASDNGSGVVAIMETARIMQNLSTERGVVFIHFDHEEDGFKGSNHYVSQVLGATMDANLYMVLNIDQIGGSKGQIDNDKIKCERDEENSPNTNNALSWLLTDTIAALCRLYTTLTPEVSTAFLSDYVPFEQQGYVITGLYQSAPDVFAHSTADTLGNMDTTSYNQAVRLSAAAAIHFAQVQKFTSVATPDKPRLSIYPNPVQSTVYIHSSEVLRAMKLLDLRGRTIQENQINNISLSFDVHDLAPGCYLIQVETKAGMMLNSTLVIQR